MKMKWNDMENESSYQKLTIKWYVEFWDLRLTESKIPIENNDGWPDYFLVKQINE